MTNNKLFNTDFDNSLNYNDVFIIPKYSDISSRKQVDISSKLGKHRIPVPVISANMESVTGARMAIALQNAGALGAQHRFQSIDRAVEDYVLTKEAQTEDYPILVSVGVNRDSFDRFEKLYEAGARHFVIDIAHGHSEHMKAMIEHIKGFNGTYVMAGNVATSQAAYDLAMWGADAVKAGIGPGCFAAGTRILMANGTYKNIEEIQAGDRVINKNGKAVSVKKSFSTGVREVVETKTNHFHENIVSTPDHKFWMGDCSSVSDKTFASEGYKKILSKRTKKGQSKFDWIEIGSSNKKTVSLLPRHIDFEMNKDFSIPLKKRFGGNQTTGFSYRIDNVLEPSYDLGYVFGTFLGDGHAHVTSWKGSNRGSCHWYFGRSESEIAEKLTNCLQNCIKTQSQIKIVHKSNQIHVNYYYKPLADFLASFGKKTEKHLPENLLVDNADYLQGIYDGLVDSDGHIDDKRECFTNTSSQLMELFGILSYKINGHFPLSCARAKSFGSLKNCNTVSENYRSKTLKRPDWRTTEDYQIVKVLSQKSLSTRIPVYDLEIDCETHSFIANNAIVHNSVCTTKNVTGVTVPGFASVVHAVHGARRAEVKLVDKLLRSNSELRELYHQHNSFSSKQGEDYVRSVTPRIVVVADGGLTEIGDICKAIGCGADFVMSGRFFAACDEAPNGTLYRGSASQDVQTQYRNDKQMPTPEGKSEILEAAGPAVDVVEDIAGGLRSAFSYVGAHNIKEYHDNCTFGVRKHPQR